MPLKEKRIYLNRRNNFPNGLPYENRSCRKMRGKNLACKRAETADCYLDSLPFVVKSETVRRQIVSSQELRGSRDAGEILSANTDAAAIVPHDQRLLSAFLHPHETFFNYFTYKHMQKCATNPKVIISEQIGYESLHPLSKSDLPHPDKLRTSSKKECVLSQKFNRVPFQSLCVSDNAAYVPHHEAIPTSS